MAKFSWPSFNQLKKKAQAQPGRSELAPVALLCDSAPQFLAWALAGSLRNLGLDHPVWTAPLDQIEQQLLSPNSELWEKEALITIVWEGGPGFRRRLRLYQEQKRDALPAEAERLKALSQAAEQRGQGLLYCNQVEIADRLAGHWSGQMPTSFDYTSKAFNVLLWDLAREEKALQIFDLNALAALHGYRHWIKPALAYQSDLQIHLDYLPAVAGEMAQIVACRTGQGLKCVILDLDNTLWGGILGDDGWENLELGQVGIGKAFVDLQHWLKGLQQRGILLAVVSKNDQAKAREAFEKHPDMVLTLDDIAVFQANWENKAKNIAIIQEVLKLGFDSMLFLDDNPFERALVRESLPGITVPELPEDPVEYLPFLRSRNWFETSSLSSNDAKRTRQYQAEAQRQNLRKSYLNEADFLAGLEMTAAVEELTPYNLPRVSQLIARSNQFNLRTERFDANQLEHWAKETGHRLLAFHLRDRIGDHGLIAVIMLEVQGQQAFIRNWLMSCRVLQRGVEHFCLEEIVRWAEQQKLQGLIGEYRPSPKNALVAEHYPKLGFRTQGENRYFLPLPHNINAKHFIQPSHGPSKIAD